ncbi:MAG: hypothetical protein JEZ03_14170 [Bacteroidales bacterium]|nr:hypothetical protein [Bacteroidales bacterium]
MRYLFSILIFILSGSCLMSQQIQEPERGTVSYVTSQNVYVKFNSTKNISVGDTLFISEKNENIPVLLVNNRSSISCVCTLLSTRKPEVNDVVFISSWKSRIVAQKEKEVLKPENVVSPIPIDNSEKQEPPGEILTKVKKKKQTVYGRISAQTYSMMSNTGVKSNQRLRYVLSLNAKKFRDSKLSFESYLSFSHKINEWDEIRDNINNGLKVYNLALNYEFNENTTLWFGRKVNNKVSSIGAVDGLQFEKKIKSFTAGVIAGSRPDWEDYSMNTNLVQAGVYLSHSQKINNRLMQSSIAFMEQKNDWNTDRRFVYFQHSNQLLKKVYFFGSGEFDLYNVSGNQSEIKAENSFRLSNLYLILRYRALRRLSFSVSYSARNNIIYHETYKDFIEQLIERETLQGFKLSTNYRPFKNISFGARAGYRYRVSDLKSSKNLYTYVNFGRLPWIKTSATIYATLLETAYISGKVYGMRLYRDILPGKVYGGFTYKYSDYQFHTAETALIQNSAELNLQWKIKKNYSFSLNYEVAIDSDFKYHRVYVNLTKRFK